MSNIIAACEANWHRHAGDCSGFCRAVAASLTVPLQGLANQIVDTLRRGGGWTVLPDGNAAAAQAAAGKLVIAGLKGTEQARPSANGHVVVVVPGPLAQGRYPSAYWGQLGGSGARNRTLNYSWTAADRDRITYAVWTGGEISQNPPEPESLNAPDAPRAPSGQTFPVHNQIAVVYPRSGRTLIPAAVLTDATGGGAAPNPPAPPLPGAGYPTARIGDTVTHGAGADGVIITGSETREVNGRPVARIGDQAICNEHGLQQVVMIVGGPDTNAKGTAHIGAMLSCGAIVITSSEDVEQDTERPAGSVASIALERDIGTLDDEPDNDDGLAIWPVVRGRAPTAAEIARSRANGVDPSAPPPTPTESNVEPPRLTVERPTDCASITDQNISDTFLLSGNFTLGALSSQAVISRARVRAQHGLTTAQIVCNLKAVAENICEPLHARYEGMIITSGFRPAAGSSQHERGQAVDVQFEACSDAEYWHRAQWVKDNITYDQFILEYLGNRPWFHLSFSRSGNRRQVLTATRPGTYLSGLHRCR